MKRGRPRTDRIETFERVAELLTVEPELTAAEVAMRLGVRKQDAQRCVRILRRVAPSERAVREVRPLADKTISFTIAPDQLLTSEFWRFLVKELAGWRCQRCDKPNDPDRTRGLQAHHVDRDPTNNRLANGAALCAECHGQLHTALRRGGDVAAQWGPFLAAPGFPKGEAA